MVKAEEIRRYGACMKDCRVAEYATLDHGLGGEERAALLAEVTAFLRA